MSIIFKDIYHPQYLYVTVLAFLASLGLWCICLPTRLSTGNAARQCTSHCRFPCCIGFPAVPACPSLDLKFNQVMNWEPKRDKKKIAQSSAEGRCITLIQHNTAHYYPESGWLRGNRNTVRHIQDARTVFKTVIHSTWFKDIFMGILVR